MAQESIEPTLLTVHQAYEYELSKGRLGTLTLVGFTTRINSSNSPYPFFKLKGTKARLIAPEDIEEMYNRQRLAAKRKVFKDLNK